MFTACGKNNEKCWKGFFLVVPSVSVGNVGQLAVDLLISTLCLEKSGYLYDDSILPVIGNDPFATKDQTKMCKLMTGAEVFESLKHKLVVVQLRSSIFPTKREQFLSKLMTWISSCDFSSVIILTASFAHERIDTQLEGTQLRYVASSDFAKTKDASVIANTLRWHQLEERSPQPGLGCPDHDDEQADDTCNSDTAETAEERAAKEECSKICILGGGFAKSLFQKCIINHIPAVLLLRFCAEGDNIFDAIELVTMLNEWLGWLDLEKISQQIQRNAGWKIPSSWRLQYGSGFQQTLFQ